MQSNPRAIVSLIRRISPSDFIQNPLTKEEFVKIASLCGSYWMHLGDESLPHAELSSGLCSNGYLNLMYVLQYPNISKILAHEILRNLPSSIDPTLIDWVVGSALTATGLAKDVANALNAKWAPLEKNSNGEQVWGRLTFASGETVLHIEDMITSGKSALSVRDAFVRAKTDPSVYIFPCIPSVAFRLAHGAISARKLLARIAYFHPLYTFEEFWTSTQADCPLCANGSRRLRPKERDNWTALTGDNPCIGQ